MSARRGTLVDLQYVDDAPVWVYGHGLDPAEACAAAMEWHADRLELDLDEDELPTLAVGSETWARWRWLSCDDDPELHGADRVCAETKRARGAFPVTEVWLAEDLEHLRRARHRRRVGASRARAAILTWWPELVLEDVDDGGAEGRHPALAGTVSIRRGSGSYGPEPSVVLVENRDREQYNKIAPPGAPIAWWWGF